MKKYLAIVFILGLFFSCSRNIENPKSPTDYNNLANLPADTGGDQVAFVAGSTEAPFGFYLYTPGGYTKNGPEYPLLVFLHGKGEIGNSQTTASDLEKVLRNGPPMLIEKTQWNPSYPMIVASPQSEVDGWDAQKIQQFIEFIMDHYQVNKKRIYVTGLSMGGFGAFYYAALGDESYAAAVVPIAGGGNKTKAGEMAKIPIWAFHGDSDHTVSVNNSITTIDAINAQNPEVRAKLTIYPGVDHNSWAMTYDGSGMGRESDQYDPFDMNIFDWMFQYQKEDLVIQ